MNKIEMTGREQQENDDPTIIEVISHEQQENDDPTIIEVIDHKRQENDDPTIIGVIDHKIAKHEVPDVLGRFESKIKDIKNILTIIFISIILFGSLFIFGLNTQTGIQQNTVIIKEIPPVITTPIQTSQVQPTNSILNASVNLHGEKTDVVLGEDILLKLSAVNLISKPRMHVQVIIIPPSGMSVTSSEFIRSGAGQFTTDYELEPGEGKDIQVSIKPNQVGDFIANGRIVYYFGDKKEKAEDYTLNIPIRVRKEGVSE